MQDWIRNKRRSAEFFENELTSCVFGPLRYMEPGHAWDACRMLFGLLDLSQESSPSPTNVCVRFWPHFSRTDGEGNYVEPDVHIVAWVGDTLLGTIVVETKWSAPLSPNQLLDQWRFVTANDSAGAEVRSCSKHVLLGWQPCRDDAVIEQQIEAAREQGINWDGRLILLSWYQVATRLAGPQGRYRPIETWRRDLVALLARHGVIPFDGFSCDRLEPVSLMRWQFESYVAPDILNVGLLNWSFNEGNAA